MKIQMMNIEINTSVTLLIGRNGGNIDFDPEDHCSCLMLVEI